MLGFLGWRHFRKVRGLDFSGGENDFLFLLIPAGGKVRGWSYGEADNHGWFKIRGMTLSSGVKFCGNKGLLSVELQRS